MKTYAKSLLQIHHLNWILIFLAGMTLSCVKESRGFVLPEGNIEKGKQLFVTMRCTDCHSIANIPWTGMTPGDIHVQLGGQTTRLKVYGELVTSVINPSHKISQKSLAEKSWTYPDGNSVMESIDYNKVMTVQQLIDLVSYLQSEYKLVIPQHYYPYN